MKPFARDLSVLELGEGSVVAGYRVGASLRRRSSDERVQAAESPKGDAATIVFARVEGNERESRARFRRLAKARARVDHPGLIPVREYGQLDSFRYLITDPYPRRSLADVLEAGPLAPRQVVQLLAPVAAALDAAHDAGVVHQSLAAESLLLAGDRLVVDAFGLAGGGVDPVFGSSRGGAQPLHASPEAARAESLEPSSNVYSLTAILVHALTGRPPFGGEAATVVYAHLTAPPPRPGEDGVLVRDIDEVVAAGMAKDAGARPVKALALIQAAATALDVPFHPLQAGPIRAGVRRRPRMSALRDLRPPTSLGGQQGKAAPKAREDDGETTEEPGLTFEPPPAPAAKSSTPPPVPARSNGGPAVEAPAERTGSPGPSPQPPVAKPAKKAAKAAPAKPAAKAKATKPANKATQAPKTQRKAKSAGKTARPRPAAPARGAKRTASESAAGRRRREAGGSEGIAVLRRLAAGRGRLVALLAGVLVIAGVGLGVLLAPGGEEAAPPRPDPALTANVRAVDALEQQRLDLRAELADAITAPDQVKAANALAGAYRASAEGVRSSRLAAAAEEVAQAYERLASAARREDGGDFAAASRAVDAAERSFQATTARVIGRP